MIPTEVNQLLRERAGHIHVHGDFAETAIAGARGVRTRRAVTAATTAALAVAVTFGLVLPGPGPDRGAPALGSSDSTSRVALPAPEPRTAIARVDAPAGPMPLPYIQAGLLHLGGKTVSIPTLVDGRLQLFATLSNGGVAYQVAGPNPELPALDAGPLTFLDRDGRIVKEQGGMALADADGRGDRVTAVADSGELVVFDVTGTVLRRLGPMGDWQSTAAAQELGGDLVANLAGHEDPSARVGSLDTGRTAYIGVSRDRADTPGVAFLALHDERTLLVEGIRGQEGCKYLTDYRTGKEVRSWCDDTRPIGFSPDGTWMYGEYWGRPGVWVVRTDDGAPLLEVRTDDTAQERFIGEFAAPSPDGTAILVVAGAEDGRVSTSACAIATGQCRALSDGLTAPGTGWLALPDNWGRQYPD